MHEHVSCRMIYVTSMLYYSIDTQKYTLLHAGIYMSLSMYRTAETTLPNSYRYMYVTL